MLFWLSLPVIELIARNTLSPKMLYWRAWEYISNYDGKDANFAPFKPWATYNGILLGDLLNVKVAPHPDEIRHQTFTVDEYGYRNPPHFLDQPIDAVVIGSSFVGGAAFSDNETVSAILTNDYGIRTYNFFSILQNYFENEPTIIHPPKFVILLGSEGELINSYFRYSLETREPVYHSVHYSSFQQWQEENETKIISYDQFAEDMKKFSILRLMTTSFYRSLFNFGRTRAQVMQYLPTNVIDYDASTDMLFWQASYDSPLLNSEGKTLENIQTAKKTLEESAQLLQQRQQILVTAAMPSKTHLELPKYQSLPQSQRALHVFNTEMATSSSVLNIDLLTPAIATKKIGRTLYFHDDSHWNVESNKMIAKELAKKLCPLLSKEHICRSILAY